MTALQALATHLRSEGGLLAEATVDPPPGGRVHEGRYGVVVEAIREGELAHYGGSRVLAAEPDLALLAGDYLYALGLAKLAQIGDLEAVTLLAGIIARCAQAHAEGQPEDAAEAWKAAETL
jgi:hypothetical protein